MSHNVGEDISILVVDDDDVDAMGIKRAVKKLGLVNPLYRATDGLEALELLKSGLIPKPYIVLLDINMPRMNGLEMLRTLRDDDALSDSVVFMVTTSIQQEEIREAYKNHVAGFITKSKLNQNFSQLVLFFQQYCQLIELPSPNM